MLISICIPTMNRPEMLSRALHSALVQTYEDIEILIFDNSDNNKTQCVIKEINDSRVYYKRHSENIGQVGNYNALIQAAKGKYIKFLNDDDLFEPECVSSFVKAAKEFPHASALTCRAAYLDEHGKYIKTDKVMSSKEYSFIQGKELPLLMLEGDVYFRTPSHTMYKRENALNIGGFDANHKYVFDVLLAYTMTKNDGALFLEGKPLIEYYRHDQQVAANMALDSKVSDQIQMMELICFDVGLKGRKLTSLKSYIYMLEILLAIKSKNIVGAKGLFHTMRSKHLSVFLGSIELLKRKIL